MRFDYTRGEPARYSVGVYRETVDDHYYFGTYRDAKTFYDKACGKEDRVSLYDIGKGVRKMYSKDEVVR